MPELPEVETVRDGLARHVLGRTVTDIRVLRDYSVRAHAGGPGGLADELVGRTLDAAVRRGKFLWLLLGEPGGGGSRDAGGAGDGAAAALMAHLGMSGQLLVRAGGAVHGEHPHLRVRLSLSGATPGEPGIALDFVDQRTFGHLSVQDLVPTPDGAPGGLGADLAAVPAPVAHIARDPLDPAFRGEDVARALRRRRTGVKRALLDQTLVSGIGNIYADEALWRARLHHARPTDRMRQGDAVRVLEAAEEVMREALAQGGTSFDALYVNVNGASGYFSRSLAVYGQEGEPCRRCGTTIRREAFMNRSSHFCPKCQRLR
ncbi:bifunctional DNA-formamidopyrimidine glycosylase/DNA-(apurinic or apyrimidinic site) lyase [Cellulomonas sp. PhB143]|uniref:bifunctional DNA-formamidopyrimidine glycosylase/DNA-(apurinic or apyrimidinic site) lyase n=1 Tax=Cellulomonas sp. PhB143 TaxID=2485186 RepID=UPI000F47AD16|nr:bifunctional DNA-formamidopyrimidine glycosylase/DNA-(apurinic or apyrimidinic site) lyase [Cellulomonas sp. PhB143]ROS73572.1 DNA-(apurinic or apyrimidinic site) lyase [Cellulomonas sp. PhB143]